MKRIIALLLVFCSFFSIMTLCGCSDSENLISSDKMSIVTTIFPIYDWTREIVGNNADDAEITLLMDNGADMHSFQPTAADIMKITTCDVLIYVGGESDSWIADALKSNVNKKTVVINLLEMLSDKVKEEEIVDGMQVEHEKDNANEVETDEHIWLSLKNAAFICERIAERLAVINPENAESYKENSKNYLEKLLQLDKNYLETVNNSSNKTLVFADRFPFRYLTDDYDIDYYAAFPGCSAETEASFETITFLADKINDLDLNYVIVLEKSDGRVADTLVSNTDSKAQKILTLNSLQSVTKEDKAAGMTYLSVMQDNLRVIEQALS